MPTAIGIMQWVIKRMRLIIYKNRKNLKGQVKQVIDTFALWFCFFYLPTRVRSPTFDSITKCEFACVTAANYLNSIARKYLKVPLNRTLEIFIWFPLFITAVSEMVCVQTVHQTVCSLTLLLSNYSYLKESLILRDCVSRKRLQIYSKLIRMFHRRWLSYILFLLWKQ